MLVCLVKANYGLFHFEPVWHVCLRSWLLLSFAVWNPFGPEICIRTLRGIYSYHIGDDSLSYNFQVSLLCKLQLLLTIDRTLGGLYHTIQAISYEL